MIRDARRLATLLVVIALAALGVAAIASAEKSVTVRAGNLLITVNGGVAPKALPKNKLTPVSLSVSGKIATADGTQPPAVTSIVVDTDKNGTVDARGVPTCKAGQLEARTSAEAEKVCKPAIVGTGKTDIELLFPESKPIQLHSKLIAFNGGIQGKATTILVHAFLTTPVTAAVVTTIKVTKEHDGPFGTHSVATVPKIGNGFGSVTAFSLTFQKRLFQYKSSKHGYLLAKCANGHFVAQAETIFANGLKLGPAKIIRPCTPKG